MFEVSHMEKIKTGIFVNLTQPNGHRNRKKVAVKIIEQYSRDTNLGILVASPVLNPLQMMVLE